MLSVSPEYAPGNLEEGTVSGPMLEVQRQMQEAMKDPEVQKQMAEAMKDPKVTESGRRPSAVVS